VFDTTQPSFGQNSSVCVSTSCSLVVMIVELKFEFFVMSGRSFCNQITPDHLNKVCANSIWWAPRNIIVELKCYRPSKQCSWFTHRSAAPEPVPALKRDHSKKLKIMCHCICCPYFWANIAYPLRQLKEWRRTTLLFPWTTSTTY